MKHLKYLSYVLRHKWYVMIECFKMRLYWQGIVHDWHKFLPCEWFPYVNFFHGKKAKPVRDETGYYKPTDTGDYAFDLAWLHHQKLARHHWQWWVLPEDDGGVKVLEMPDKYLKEMICDWKGAGKAQGTPNTLTWYRKNKDKMMLGETTRKQVEEVIGFEPS
tara:strand:- start:1445 stop:1930 length:486 start_codon:yes stop_codon:yes gene_type:complete